MRGAWEWVKWKVKRDKENQKIVDSIVGDINEQIRLARIDAILYGYGYLRIDADMVFKNVSVEEIYKTHSEVESSTSGEGLLLISPHEHFTPRSTLKAHELDE